MKKLPEFDAPILNEFGSVSLLRKRQIHEIVMRPDGAFEFSGRLISDCNKEEDPKGQSNA